jgi:hypothetical protein
MLLPDELFERARAYPLRKRRGGVRRQIFQWLFVEETFVRTVRHELKLLPARSARLQKPALATRDDDSVRFFRENVESLAQIGARPDQRRGDKFVR